MPIAVGIGLAATVGTFAHIIGFDRDRAFYATILTVIGSYYVLFAVMAGGGPDLITELAFFGVFAALAIIGFRASLWVVVAGLALHGVFDFFRHSLVAGRGVPEWWPAFCGAYDVVAALGLATLLVLQRPRRTPRLAAIDYD